MDEVICPYCGKCFRIETCDIAGNEEFIDMCPHCEKEVQIYAEAVLELSAYKPKYFECEVCGKKEFEIDKVNMPYEIPGSKKWEYKALCPSCYFEEIERRRGNL